MNKILFGTLGATVALMTACTDYVADIEEAHNEYVAAMQKPESATTSSSCVCNLQVSNLLRDNFGNLYYDYSILGDGDIYWKVDGCNDGYIISPRLDSSFPGNMDAGLYLDETPDMSMRISREFSGKITVGGPYSSVIVGVEVGLSSPNFGGTISCPTVEVRGVNYGSSSASTGSTACGDMWCGLKQEIVGTWTYSWVNTGHNKSINDGYWYEFTDQGEDGGNSYFTYPVEPRTGGYLDYLGPIIEQYGGIKGTVTLQNGYDYPYAGLGFDIVGAREGTDVTDWDGLCIVYKSTVDFYLKIPVENDAVVVDYDNFNYKLPKTSGLTAVDIAWDNFKQAGFGTKIDRAEALKKVAAVTLEFNDEVGTPQDFFIQSIGRYGTCQ